MSVESHVAFMSTNSPQNTNLGVLHGTWAATGENRALLSQITARLIPHLSEWFGSGARLAASIPDVFRRNWSFFLRYGVDRPDGLRVGLLVKVPRMMEMETLAQAISAQELVPGTLLEYQALLTCAKAFEFERGHAFVTIRALAFLPEWNAIVMEELALEPIKNALFIPGMLMGFKSDWQGFEAILNMAGRWLRIFHERVGAWRIEPLPRETLGSETLAACEELEQASRGKVRAKRCSEAILHRLEAIEDVPIPLAELHGDFNCANIFTTPDGRLGVLDTIANQRGPVYTDLAILVNDLRTRRAIVLAHGALLRHDRIADCDKAFLQGYFGTDPYERKVLEFCCAVNLVHKWAEDERTLASTASGVAGRLALPIVRHYFDSLLSRYVGQRVV